MKAILEMVVKEAISKDMISDKKLEGSEEIAIGKYRKRELWAECLQVK